MIFLTSMVVFNSRGVSMCMLPKAARDVPKYVPKKGANKTKFIFNSSDSSSKQHPKDGSNISFPAFKRT